MAEKVQTMIYKKLTNEYSGTPASSTTKTGRHDISEILLKVALNTINQIKSNLLVIILSVLQITACG
jgi:hypothetical protein